MMMKSKKTLSMLDNARHLLPEPGSEVVGDLIAELLKAQDHLEMAWVVIANAGTSLGDWSSMTPEWREAAEKWRDEWFKMIKDGGAQPPSDEKKPGVMSEQNKRISVALKAVIDLFDCILKSRICIGNRWKCDNGHEWVTAHCDTTWFCMPTTCPECGHTATAHRGEWKTLNDRLSNIKTQSDEMDLTD